MLLSAAGTTAPRSTSFCTHSAALCSRCCWSLVTRPASMWARFWMLRGTVFVSSASSSSCSVSCALRSRSVYLMRPKLRSPRLFVLHCRSSTSSRPHHAHFSAHGTQLLCMRCATGRCCWLLLKMKKASCGAQGSGACK